MPGAQVKNYLKACVPAQYENIDQAYIVQPDGVVLHYGIALWNQEAQAELAPGALVWAPSRSSEYSAKFSLNLVKFLATQNYETVLNADVSRPVYLGASAVAKPAVAASSLPMTASDWGFVGLLQTPSARMSPAGDARFNTSRVYPYERINVFVQPFDWLEAGFRYQH
jgi:hypothetical protein